MLFNGLIYRKFYLNFIRCGGDRSSFGRSGVLDFGFGDDSERIEDDDFRVEGSVLD